MNEIISSQANIGLAPKAKFSSGGKENFIHFRETDNQLFTPKTIEKIISGRATPEELFVLKLYLKARTGKPIDFEKGLEQESVKRAIQELYPSATGLNAKLLEAMKGEIIVTNSYEVLKDGGLLGFLKGDRRLSKETTILSIKSSDPSTWKVNTFNAVFSNGADKAPNVTRSKEDNFYRADGALPDSFSNLKTVLPNDVQQRDNLAKSLAISDYPILEDPEINTKYQRGVLKYLQNSASSPNKAILEKILQETLLTNSSKDKGSLLSSEMKALSSNLGIILNKKIDAYTLLNKSGVKNTPTQQLVSATEEEILALFKIHSTLNSSDAKKVFLSRQKDLSNLTDKYDLNSALTVRDDAASIANIAKRIEDDFVWGRKDISHSSLKALQERLSELSKQKNTLLENNYPEIFINSPSHEHLSLNNINKSLGVKTTENNTRIEPESLYPPSLKAKVNEIINKNPLALSLSEPLKEQLMQNIENSVRSKQFPTNINVQNKFMEAQVKSLLENNRVSLGPKLKELDKLKLELKDSIKTNIQALIEKDENYERNETQKKQEKVTAEKIKLLYLLANQSERKAFFEETRANDYPQLKNITVNDLINSFSKQVNAQGTLVDTPIHPQDNLTTRLWFAGKGRDDPRNEDHENSIPNFKRQISMVNAFLDSPSKLDPAFKQKTKSLLSNFTGLQDMKHYDSLAGYDATKLKEEYPYLKPRQGEWIESNLSDGFGAFGWLSSMARFAVDTVVGRKNPSSPDPDIAHAATLPVQEISDPSKEINLPQGTFGQLPLKGSNLLVTYQINDPNSPLNGEKLYFMMPAGDSDKQLFSKMAKEYGLGETDLKKWILSEIYNTALNAKQNGLKLNYEPLADKVREIVSASSGGDVVEMLNFNPLFQVNPSSQESEEISNSFLLGASDVKSFTEKLQDHMEAYDL
jgi:hypothetical protein